jgi:outer membrane protein assembly factor BamB
MNHFITAGRLPSVPLSESLGHFLPPENNRAGVNVVKNSMDSIRRWLKNLMCARARTLGVSLLGLLCLAGPGWAQDVNVLTQHSDLARTGANLQEITLTPATVASGQFGLLFSLPVDGQVYAQPLYVSNLAMADGVHNVLYVATEHNSVYAFDADGSSASPLWQVNLGPAAPQDPDNDPDNVIVPDCRAITPEVGITSTPVIDLEAQTLYVLAKTQADDGSYHQTLYGLTLSDGTITAGVEIGASVGDGETAVVFDPQMQLNRPALLLVNGLVYAAFGSHCDVGEYHGWVLSYDAQSLFPAAVYIVTPGGDSGAVWQSGQGPAADVDGQIYIETGNGTFSPDGQNLGDSVVKLAPGDGALNVAGFFTPWNVDFLNEMDFEIGSAGPLLLPDTPFALAAGKEGRFYLLDTSNLGGFNEDGDAVLQSFQVTDVQWDNEIAGSPIYWASPDGPRVYVWATNEALKAVAFDGAFFNPVPVAQSTVTSPPYVWPGGILSLSANGNEPGTGIVWASLAQSDTSEQTAPGILRAFDAENVSIELWNSDLDPADSLGDVAKFCPPTVANGKVYMATFSGVIQVYGLRP